MKFKHQIPFLIKSSIDVACLIILLLWAYIAIKKYESQPIATYVSFNKGDDGINIEFPYITICPFPFDLETELSFVDHVKDIMRNETNFDLNGFMEERMADVSHLVLSASKDDDDEANLTGFFAPSFQPIFGFCVGLDAEKMDIKVNNGKGTYSSSFSIELDDTVWTWFGGNGQLFFHSKYDWPDAMDTNPSFLIKKGQHESYSLKKKRVSTDPTRKVPCGSFDVDTCIMIFANAKIAETFKCRLSFFRFEKVLDRYIHGYTDLPFCSAEVAKEAFDLACDECESQCNNVKACSTTLYSITKEPIASEWIDETNLTMLHFSFSTFQVEHYTTYISYDFQSLIAEIGGLMGMTLGLAFSSLGDLIANLAKKYL